MTNRENTKTSSVILQPRDFLPPSPFRDRGLDQRILVASQILNITPESDEFWQYWREIATHPESPEEFHATLAFLVVFARYPSPEELENFIQRVRLNSFDSALQELFCSLEYDKLRKGRIEYGLILPAQETLFVDLTQTISCSQLTGIQRVVRFLCKAWSENKNPVEFYIFRNDTCRPSLLTDSEQHFFLNWIDGYGAKCKSDTQAGWALLSGTLGKMTNATERLRPVWVLAARFGRRVKTTLSRRPANDSPLPQNPQNVEVPVFIRNSLLCPELCFEGHRLDFYLGLKRGFHESHLSMILYDLIPIMYPEYVPPIVRSSFANYLRLFRAVDAISCISADIERQAQHMVDCIRELHDVVLATHDLPGIIREADGQSIEDDTSADSSAPYILCVGTIEPRKNQEKLLHACMSLMRQGLSFRLIFVGNPGWGGEAVQSKIIAAKKQGFDVEIKNSVSENELVQLYKNSSFTVYCSHAEGFGLPIVESLRYGKAVVVSDRGCMRDLGLKLGGCFFIDPDHQKTLEDAIQSLLLDNGVLKELEGTIRFDGWPDWNDYARQVFTFIANDFYARTRR